MQPTTIKCAFCKGTGNSPYFEHACPVCKGEKSHCLVGKYMTCRECHGSGHKGGTTLTCYTCAGVGVLPDIREALQGARQEIRNARREMEEEKVR